MFTDKKTQAVAEAVRKVMEADLSVKQKKIAAVAGDPKKIDAPDFKKLRGEEVDQMDEDFTHKKYSFDAKPYAHLDQRDTGGKVHHTHPEYFVRTSANHDLAKYIEKAKTHKDTSTQTIANSSHRELKNRVANGTAPEKYKAHLKEEVEQMDELSRGTLKSYVKKAGKSAQHYSFEPSETHPESWKVLLKRRQGINIAKDKIKREEVEQIDEAPMKSGAQSRREVDSVMDKYGFGSKQKEAPKSNTRAVAGKSYGADYKDPEGADDADDKKPEAGPKKSVKKGVFKRRYNTKAYTKESFTGLLNDYKDGGVKSLLESLEIVEVEGDEQIDESLDSIAKKHGMKYTTTAYGAGMKHPTKGEISINRYGEWHHKGTNKTGDSENSFSSLDKHLSTVKEEIEQMDEDEMTQKKKEKVVTVKHKDSGKELRVVKAAVADYQKRGYHPVKEEVEQIDERHLTDTETATKEHNVKSMKKNLSGFKERYGKDAKSVMYATATKQAKED